MTKSFCHFIYIPLFKPSCLMRLWSNKKLIKIFCIKGCTFTVGWFSIFFWAKILFLHYSSNYLKSDFLVSEWIFWRFDFDHYFQPEARVYPSKWVIHMLFNSAPRKFKNLGTDAFIAPTITKFFLVISRCSCNKGVRSRQEYIKMSSIANFWLWCKRIWDLGKSP